MKSACSWLLVLLSLVAATQAIKCLCDKDTLCFHDAAETEEECPVRYDEDFYKQYPEEIKYMDEYVVKELPRMKEFSDDLRRNLIGLPPLTEAQLIEHTIQWKEEVKFLMSNLSFIEKNLLQLSIKEVNSFVAENVNAGNKPGKEVLNKMDQVFNGTYEPKLVDYIYCIKKIDGKGNVSRSCGMMAVANIGNKMKVGCHNNPVYNVTYNDYPKYCRCDTDLCNSGDVGVTEEDNASSSPKLSSFLLAGSLMRVCFSVVMSQICRT